MRISDFVPRALPFSNHGTIGQYTSFNYSKHVKWEKTHTPRKSFILI